MAIQRFTGRIQQRFSTLAAITATNPILLEGEVWTEKDASTGRSTGRRKVGDGVIGAGDVITGTAFNSLPFEPTAGVGSGDVVGPASATDGRAALFDGATGKLLKVASAAPVLEGDARLSDAREWTAATIEQAEAEAGTATTRRAFTAQRVFQAVAAWWAASAAATKLSGIATGATANSSDATLLARANHTGTQAAGTITGLAAVATSGAYGSLSGLPTLPSGDWDTLIGTELSITNTATATLGRMHVCSGTAADYTVTLPTAVSNSGKIIGFRMAAALTRLITLDGNASETIDGALTRVMWANEVAILRSDGSNWHKIAGKSIPMSARISRRSTDGAQDISEATVTTVLLVRSVFDNTTRMQDLANNAVICRRPGVYIASGTISWGSLPNALAMNVQGRVTVNGTFREYLGPVFAAAASGSYPVNVGSTLITLADGDSVTLRAYQDQSSGSAAYPLYLENNDGTCNFGLSEYITW
jgi:hypothetical protein